MTRRTDSRFVGEVFFGSSYVADDVIDEFSYDPVNRLIRADIIYVDQSFGAIEVVDYNISYDAAGRRNTLDYQGSSISYSYDANHIHGVKTTSDGKSYGYDAVGNQTLSDERTLQYTAFNKTRHISNANGYHQVAYTYGANNEKLTRTDIENGEETLTWYVGNVEIITEGWESGVPGSIKSKRYVGDNTVITHHGPEAIDVEYIHKDHLGSTQVISRQQATLNGFNAVYHVSYDAFGKVRANINPNHKFFWLPSASVTNKGFTGQDHISDLGLINFKARLYDPKLGMMMQADTIVPDGPVVDSLNRYAYVYNNPLSYTDPTGHSPMWFNQLTPAVQNTVNNHVRNGNLLVQSKAMQATSASKFLSAVRGANTSGVPAGTKLSGYANFDVFLQLEHPNAVELGKDSRKTKEGWNITAYGVFDSKGNRKTLKDMGVVSQSDPLTWSDVGNTVNFLFNPFQGVSECYTDGCGWGGWAMATIGIVPVVKWGRRGGKLLDETPNQFLKPGGGSNSADFITEHSQKHMFDSSQLSRPNRSQFGQDIDVAALRRDTMSNPNSAFSDVNSRITKYSKEFDFNISTSDTPTGSMRVFINNPKPNRSTQFPYVPRNQNDR